jgi:CheY-like chemotaxis protein
MPNTPTDTGGVAGEHPTVILAEDEVFIRWVTADQLRHAGYIVLEAGSGATALELLIGHPEAALLITDQRMPGMSGSELAAETRRLRPDLPIIFLSGYMFEVTITGAAHLSKPYTPDQLLDTMARVLTPSSNSPSR